MKTLAPRNLTMRLLLATLAAVFLPALARADVDPLVLQAERARVDVVERASRRPRSPSSPTTARGAAPASSSRPTATP